VVTPDEMVSHQRRLAEAEEAARMRARAGASAAARLAAERLVDAWGAQRVVLVGSLADGTFGPGSDLDLVVEGLDEELRCRARRDLEVLTGLDVDLLAAESLDDRLQLALAVGIVLHDGG